MNTQTALELLLDSGRLSEVYGQEVKASSVRIKPEVALIAAIAHPVTGAELGWLRLLWPVSHSKAKKASKLAQSLGQTTRVHQLSDQLLCDTGGVAADPALAELLAQATTPTLPAGAAQAVQAQAGAPAGDDRLLRYNPLRRVVYRRGDSVVRVQARPGVLDHGLYSRLAQLAPLPQRLDEQRPGESGRQVSVVQHCGHHDLAACDQAGQGTDSCLAHHQAAGRIWAGLHAGGATLPSDIAAALAGRVADPRAQAHAHAQILDHLDAPLAARLRRLAAHPGLEVKGPAVLSHGDASPDQVLVDAHSGRLWLTDFDRVCLAPAARDLGSYLAEAGTEAGEAFLAGYAQGGQELPKAEELRAAWAASLLERAAGPLRTAAPDWAERINELLDEIEEVLR
ncbi:aminoglycoside phosphotransferase family protein [Buchananella felis]|uniref:phosphotransferase family protein n=1 Tax=Buchananella felis TaxID=3231492 RepID=UPI003526E11A